MCWIFLYKTLQQILYITVILEFFLVLTSDVFKIYHQYWGQCLKTSSFIEIWIMWIGVSKCVFFIKVSKLAIFTNPKFLNFCHFIFNKSINEDSLKKLHQYIFALRKQENVPPTNLTFFAKNDADKEQGKVRSYCRFLILHEYLIRHFNCIYQIAKT